MGFARAVKPASEHADVDITQLLIWPHNGIESTTLPTTLLFTFYAMLGEGNLRHSGTDAEYAQHVLQTVGQMTDRGWKISKMRQRQRIDALVATVMATYGAVIQSEGAIMPGFFSV